MLVASVVETRGAERFKLVSEALEDPDLKRFYKLLWVSEAKHGHLFVKFLEKYPAYSDGFERLKSDLMKRWENERVEHKSPIILDVTVQQTLRDRNDLH